MSEQAFDASLDLLRRLNPKNISDNLIKICRIAPDLSEDLLSSIDIPLQLKKCLKTGKEYLTCDYNRDGDSYRSPWSNVYYPKLPADIEEDAPKPSSELRKLEIFANESFDIYRDLYYEGGVSSVYLWDQDEEINSSNNNGLIGSFAGAILLKKKLETSLSSWDSIHVVEVIPSTNSAVYKLTSTIILELQDNDPEEDFTLSLSGNLTRQTEKEIAITDNGSHIANIGSFIEDVESKLRNMLQEVYFGKTKDIIGDLRSVNKLSDIELDKQRQSTVIRGIQGL
ncbi:F-actin-capping protein subunit beta [Ascoidea rubescens DSM 1968]|uniref:F-actin-capping protein subunit beta n=1 Tax=Ascoidea rubescens DSM 1968 TaxID=1344418 RepID=A0A1D2VI18_9ASCO|nr:beta subunit of the capping protein heterodimer [Ascoidea rubescens DSM 1968]ODV61296.1 beta subunit of the capping protein heterodimer [Ascoidea rubescens DSM 1968]